MKTTPLDERPTPVTVHLIGNAHIDPVYMWRWPEGLQEIRATFQSALDRMNEFADFIFTGSSAAFYKWIKEIDPGMFAEIRDRVAEGRWAIVGGWWVQPDCNIPSGESFVRHGLYSQMFFKEHLGVTASVGYNPDSFGHAASLPQILKQSGLTHYVFMRPNRYDNPQTLPGAFWWEGIDGSRVLAYHIPPECGYGHGGYDGQEVTKLKEVIAEAAERVGDGMPAVMGFFGVSNHGGGPTIRQLEYICERKALGDAPPVFCSSPMDYFAALADVQSPLPIWQGELQHFARGCYTSQSEVKALNQRAETTLVTTEKLSCLAQLLTGLPYPQASLTQCWQDVLFNQFHDILSGTSNQAAYDDVREQYGRVLHEANWHLNQAIQTIARCVGTRGAGVPVLIFNPHPVRLELPVEFELDVFQKPEEWGIRLLDAQGKVVPHQYIRSGVVFWPGIRVKVCFRAQLPPLGYRIFRIVAVEPGTTLPDHEPAVHVQCAVPDWTPRLPIVESGVPAAANSERQGDCNPLVVEVETFPQTGGTRRLALENEFLRLEWDRYTGALIRLFDKRQAVDLLGGPGLSPVVCHDTSDTWAMGRTEFGEVCGRFGDASLRVLEEGPVRVAVRVKQTYNQSTIIQDYILYQGVPHVEVRVKVNWQEQLKTLKLSMPTSIRGTMHAGIPYGMVERPLDGQEQPFQDWLDLSGEVAERPCGLGLVCGAKYGYDASDGEIRLTVLRSPVFCCMTQDLDTAEDYIYMDQGWQSFSYLLVPHAGRWQTVDYPLLADRLEQPPIVLVEYNHDGTLPATHEGLWVEGEGIQVGAWKQAEDGEGWIIRCIERTGEHSTAKLHLTSLQRTIPLQLQPYEITTLRIPSDDTQPIIRTNLLENSLAEQ